jgi:hypothetical protein
MIFSQFEEKGKVFTNVITKQPVSVHLQTACHLVQGLFHVKPDERLKDELNQSESFIAITDAKIYSLDGKLLHTCAFLAVNISQIVWLFQDDERIKLQEAE